MRHSLRFNSLVSHFGLWCVYVHRIEERVIYVGMGTIDRAFTTARRPSRWRDAVEAAGYVEVQVIEWFEDRYAASEYERELIAELRPPFNTAHQPDLEPDKITSRWEERRRWHANRAG